MTQTNSPAFQRSPRSVRERIRSLETDLSDAVRKANEMVPNPRDMSNDTLRACVHEAARRALIAAPAAGCGDCGYVLGQEMIAGCGADDVRRAHEAMLRGDRGEAMRWLEKALETAEVG